MGWGKNLQQNDGSFRENALGLDEAIVGEALLCEVEDTNVVLEFSCEGLDEGGFSWEEKKEKEGVRVGRNGKCSKKNKFLVINKII